MAQTSKSVLDLMVTIASIPSVDAAARERASEIATTLRARLVFGDMFGDVFDQFRPAPR